MRAMIEDLNDYSVDEINKAFKTWRQKHSKIPTPASIIKIIHSGQQEESGGLKKFSEWDGSWQEYLAYLDDNNALSMNFIMQAGLYKLRPGYNPPWDWKDFK